MKAKRKGFAIILVAALAGLIFLLGATLVVVTRLQTASSNYDQRVRLAREHARAAMDMAVAELQHKLGKDTSVSFSADTLSGATTEDFKVDRTGAVREPFWTGASDGGSTSWLVTKSLGGASVSPEGAFTGDQVELLGTGTVGSNDLLKVSVPTEAIKVDGVDGFAADSERTIGNYGYWIGDLGVKASYALYDRKAEVNHDEYDSFRKDRLSQIRISKPEMGIAYFDTNKESAKTIDGSNPMRIQAFVNELQFRDRFGASGETERYLLGLSEDDVSHYFHDFTPLSKGLLVNTANGGLREDLSNRTATSDADYDKRFLGFVTLAKSAVSRATSYDDDVFSVGITASPIVPIITQFNLNYSVYLSSDTAGNQSLYVSFYATVELWNPYSSFIDLGENRLRLEMVNIPQLKLSWSYKDSGSVSSPIILDLPNRVNPIFLIGKIGGDGNTMRPGQVAYFGKPIKLVPEDVNDARYLLSFGGEGTSADRIEFAASIITIPSGETVDSLQLTFWEAGLGEVDPDFRVKLCIDGMPDQVVVYDPPGTFTPASGVVTDVVLGESPGGKPSFGFGWKVGDAFLSENSAYHPLNPSIPLSGLVNFSEDSYDINNRSPVFGSAETDLLGYNPKDLSGTLDKSFDLSVLQLPKQEMGSVSNLSGAYGNSWLYPAVGDPNCNENDLFDRFFFSTIPDKSTLLVPNYTLPNSNYVPFAGATEVDLNSSDSAKHLFVHGMFNIHSTSIDAWTALLKGSPANSSVYWSSVFGDDRYLFFNYPLGGEDINEVFSDKAPVKDTNEAVRASFRTNVFALTGAEVQDLAKSIVLEIRKYVQVNGPFKSLKEFVDAGIIQKSITSNKFVAVDTKGTGSQFLNAGWVIAGSPAEFRQSTVLNLLGPYLSVRSDTFLIRAYGDAVDPSNPSETVWARAYCEAIVQRTVEQHGDIVEASAVDKSALNRRFEIVAFRWLSPSEI